MSRSLDDALTVGEAAELLGVTTTHVQHLGRTGQVSYLARGLLDGASVRRFRAERQGRSTRAWAGRTAWAAIAVLSGRSAEWLGQAQVSRLRSRLRTMDGSALVAATRNRATAQRFTGHQAVGPRLREDRRVAVLRSLDGLAGPIDNGSVEAYVAPGDAMALAQGFGLRSAVHGDVVLHGICTDQHGSPTVSVDWVRDVMHGPVLPALHSATSEDPRERGLAMRVLDERLKEYADG